MKLSNVLKEMDPTLQFKMIDERSFDCLALVASDLKNSNCIFLDGLKYKELIKPNVSMILTTEELMGELKSEKYGLCILEEPRLIFFKLHNYLSDIEGYKRKTFKTTIGKNCIISPQACISGTNVKIGDNVLIEEFVSIKENVSINDNCIIRSGATIGGQGFEFKRVEGYIESVSHIGGVNIGKNVEIQYGTKIDKAVYPWDDTLIGDYTKIDNLVHVGHAAKIAENVMIVAHAGIGGRTIIKKNTWIGFGAIIKNGLVIGENARANMGAIVTKNIMDNEAVTGNFAIEHSKFLNELKKKR